uniref:Putative secreted protein n=1 Tax=Anopheles marajoara TaxID=58244 RepID=A0A2M4C7A8_9DIPT
MASSALSVALSLPLSFSLLLSLSDRSSPFPSGAELDDDHDARATRFILLFGPSVSSSSSSVVVAVAGGGAPPKSKRMKWCVGDAIATMRRARNGLKVVCRGEGGLLGGGVEGPGGRGCSRW